MHFQPRYFLAFLLDLHVHAFATMHGASCAFPSVQWEDTESCRQQCQEIFQRYRLIHLRRLQRPKMDPKKTPELQSLLLDFVSQSDISDHWTTESTAGSLQLACVALAGAQTEDPTENGRRPKVGEIHNPSRIRTIIMLYHARISVISITYCTKTVQNISDQKMGLPP